MTKSSDDVIDLAAVRRAREENGDIPALHKRKPRVTCRHKLGDYDLRARTLECRDCGAPLDPLMFLDRIARDWNKLAMLRERLKHKTEDLAALIAEERLTKARLKRARKSLRKAARDLGELERR